MTKKKKIGLIVGMSILLFVAVASLLIATLPVFKNSIHYDESNTVEHSATVKIVVEKERGYEIAVDEYDCTLVFSKEEIIDEKSLLELSAGDVITFRVLDFCDEFLITNEMPSLWIFALKTDDADIVTLESHSQMEYNDYKGAQKAAFVFASLFLCGAIICLVFLIKQSRVKKPLES